jgi:hypothetical protein
LIKFFELIGQLITGKRPSKFVTFAQLSALHPGFSVGRLRWLRQCNAYDFNRCVHKVGKRVFIDVHAFEAWVTENEQEG